MKKTFMPIKFFKNFQEVRLVLVFKRKKYRNTVMCRIKDVSKLRELFVFSFV